MRLATYNIEWFSTLFDEENRPSPDMQRSARYDVTRAQQIEAIVTVLRSIDADALMVIEAPDHSRNRNTLVALETFAERFGLRTTRAVMGFSTDTQQEIALLFDPAQLTAVHDPQGGEALLGGPVGPPRFDGAFHIDLDVDATEDTVRFSKPPLELAVETSAGRRLRMIGAHLKSKAPHGARTRDEIMRISIANRRKQLAQAIWLRRRIEQHLSAGDSICLLGDLNDGPGLDEYEHLFGRSSVEIIMGAGDPEMALFDPHASRALERRLGASPTTARFYIEREDRYLQALLDYIMISPDLASRRPSWRIWHPFDDPHCWRDDALRNALLTASDHFPVSMDIEL